MDSSKIYLSVECVFSQNLQAPFSPQSKNLYEYFQLFYCTATFIAYEGKQKNSIYAINLALFDTFGGFSRPIWNKKQEKVPKFLWNSPKCAYIVQIFKK